MPQKKKTANKKNQKKKRINPNKQNIVIQSIPNYSSSQSSGHQYNSNKNVSFAPAVQQESRTDNLVGDLVGRLISKIETDGNKQTQEYSKEIQPVTNTNQPVNNNNVNIYNTVPGTTTESSGSSGSSSGSSGSSSGSSGSSGSDTVSRIQESVKTQAIDATSGAIGGVITAGIGAVAAGIYNRKKLGEGIKKLFKKDGDKLGGSLVNSRLVDRQNDYVRGTKPGVYTDLQRAPKVKGSNAEYSAAPNPLQGDFDKYISETTKDKIKRIQEQAKQFEQSRKISTPTITPRASPSPSISAPPINLSLSPQPIYINQIASELKKRNSARLNLSFSSPEITNARPSGIQQHNGVSTRSIRAETGEPHVQLEMGTQTQARGRGRTRIRPFGPEPQPNPRGRPRSTIASQAETPVPTRQSVTRKIGTGKKSN